MQQSVQQSVYNKVSTTSVQQSAATKRVPQSVQQSVYHSVQQCV